MCTALYHYGQGVDVVLLVARVPTYIMHLAMTITGQELLLLSLCVTHSTTQLQ